MLRVWGKKPHKLFGPAAFDKEKSEPLAEYWGMANKPVPIAPGSVLADGNLKILSRLGVGGFGEVFLAQTQSGLKAVKVVETSDWEPEEYQVFNAMFMSEASFLRTLSHPGIPKSDGFFAEGSRYFLIMEWLKGPTLEEYVEREGPLFLDEFMGLVDSLTRVLDYLHVRCERVVVFGDLKPANIVRRESGTYSLCDLGLTSFEGSKMSKKIAVFSPNYSAPERARGGASERSNDIYSLGATVYFALTGREPEKTLQSREQERLVRLALERQSEDWGRVALHQVGNLIILLLACLDPDPNGRPPAIRVLRESWQRARDARDAELSETGSESTDSIMKHLYERKQV